MLLSCLFIDIVGWSLLGAVTALSINLLLILWVTR